MRRILRKIATNESKDLGDISTLADEAIVEILIEKVQAMHNTQLPDSKRRKIDK